MSFRSWTESRERKPKHIRLLSWTRYRDVGKSCDVFSCMGPLNHKVGGQYGWKTAGWGSCTCVQCGQQCFFFLLWFNQENVGTSVSQKSSWQMPVQMRRKDLSKTGAPSKISFLRLILNGGCRIYSSQCWTLLANTEHHETIYVRVYFGIFCLAAKALLQINLYHTSQLGCKWHFSWERLRRVLLTKKNSRCNTSADLHLHTFTSADLLSLSLFSLLSLLS